MKKLILIVLIVCFVVSIGIVALAKVSFGNWSKWHQELPPADNEAWYWAVKTNKPSVLNLKDFNITLLFSDTYFFGTKSGKTKASVFFYSSGMDVEKWDIPDASLALAAFPPKKNKMIIRAYKMEENKIFKFFEQWEIPFKKEGIVVPKDTKFRKEFEEWVKSQISFEITISQLEDLIHFMLPKLVIINENTFMITNMISD